MKRLTARRLRDLLHYDPITGVITWRPVRSGRGSRGAVAGTIKPDGYIVVQIDGHRYAAERLVWAIVTGRWPAQLVTFRNRRRSDLRWENLCAISVQKHRQQQEQVHESSQTGVRGVAPSGYKKGGYKARIKVDGKSHFLGWFTSIGEGELAYWFAKALLHRA